MAFKAMVKNKF